jgi:hypothetical protein
MTSKLIAAAAALTLSATALPALAQNNSGLVVVDLSGANIANNIARDLDVNVSQIPVNVQVPIGVAATICGVNANVLASQRKAGDPVTCTATSTSQALNQVVQRQLNNQGAAAAK